MQRGKFIIQALQGARALLQHTGGHLTCPEKLQRAQQVMQRLAKEATQFADKEGLRQRRGAWKLHAYTVVLARCSSLSGRLASLSRGFDRLRRDDLLREAGVIE